MNIEFSSKATKAIAKMDATTKGRIGRKIKALPDGNTKKLQGHTALYRLRVGDWRIVFSYPDNDTILIEDVAPRGQIYKGV
ncbi:MAG: type II toxin-antitoxin system RelE/ParE family toxin [Defluviitaleaceae bacterium]|nr:type II toxin-antitoxin system RelE/ParE family toxin [Defluviitaleaceae bacterium]